MARISSSTLFNFTDSLDYLIDNLSKGIYCHNTYEKLPLRDNGYRVPMACFCDIPLSMIKEHFDWYGRYGIGIDRSYARRHGVKPVWYVTSENNLVRNLINRNDLTADERKNLLPFLKQFIGYQSYKGKNPKEKKFYDEREWRYIPDNSLVEPLFGVNKFYLPQSIEKNNHRMKLNLSIIEYIIIEKEEDFDRMLVVLKELGTNKNVKFESLVSKLITAKQIERDF